VTALHRAAALAVVALACWGLAWAAARALVVAVPLRHADAAFVLSGAPVYFERVACAGGLYSTGRVAAVVLTNDGVRGSWSRTLQRNPLYYERGILRLTAAGVPESAIEVLQGPIASTYDEAQLLREYVDANPVHSVIVVASPYHTRRALWIVRKALKDRGVAVGIESSGPDAPTPSPATWWLHGDGWRMVGAEFLKLPYYWLRYW